MPSRSAPSLPRRRHPARTEPSRGEASRDGLSFAGRRARRVAIAPIAAIAFLLCLVASGGTEAAAGVRASERAATDRSPTPSASPTPKPTDSPRPTASPSPSPTLSPSPSPSPTSSPSPTLSPSPTVSPTPTASPTPVEGAVYVAPPPLGSDASGDGSRGAPFATIQRAIDAAPVGGEAIALPGLYSVFAELNFHGKAMTLRSEAGREATVLRGGNGNRAFVFNSGETPETRVVGLTITGFSGTVGRGAGILMENASPTIVDCIVSNCRTIAMYVNPFQSIGSQGGGVWIHGGSPTFRECSIVDNVAGAVGGSVSTSINGYGGGVYCQEANIVMEDCAVSRNVAERAGGQGSAYGGIFLLQCDTLLSRCTISENSASEYGGLTIYGGQTCVVNCTVSGNVAVGLYASGLADSSIHIEHSSIVYNIGDDPQSAGGLIVSHVGGSLIRGTLRNSVVALNNINSVGQIGGHAISLGGNIVSDDRGNIEAHPTDALATDPLLDSSPIAFRNGIGFVPLPGSPMIDSALQSFGIGADQRGASRVCDGNGDGVPAPDIGALEKQTGACIPNAGLPVLEAAMPFDVNLDGVTDAADMIAYPEICPSETD